MTPETELKPGARDGRRSRWRSAGLIQTVCALLLLAGCTFTGRASDIYASGPQPAPRNGAFHPVTGHPYRTANSYEGIMTASREGHAWIDIDSHHCVDASGRAVAVATHWPLVATEFEDLSGPLATDVRWSEFPCERLGDLRGHPPHTEEVQLMTDMVRWVAESDLLGIEWEIKPGAPGFRRPAIYRPVLRLADELGVEIVVKTLDKLGHERALEVMRAAKKAGARTMLLNTGRPSLGLTTEEQSHLDYVRGDWHTT